mmetsp:Transcript_7788/g.22165  ORF Transcript_7788/g.22165 Transcript_7788/m.22165 type:complete len:379 (+) Transcript_7788:187-1323(+)
MAKTEQNTQNSSHIDKGFGDPLGSSLRYERLRDINSGSFGFVQECRDKVTGEKVAIKFVARKDADTKTMKYHEREIVNHSRLHHPFIVELKDFFLLPKYQVSVMELADAGDLFDHVIQCGGLEEPIARRFFQQFIIGLEYCHSNGIVNRDIKPENTLLQSGADGLTVKMCDFGNSKDQEKGSQARTRVGSPQYMAPEVIECPQTYDGKKADMWSCGVMLYVMLMARYPFLGPDEKMNHSKIFQRMQAGAFLLKDSLSDEVKSLVKSLMVVDPEQRMTLAEVKEHPWFTQDIPEGLLEMNETLQDRPSNLASAEEILRIIRTRETKPPRDPNLKAASAAEPVVSANDVTMAESGSSFFSEDTLRQMDQEKKDGCCCVIC